MSAKTKSLPRLEWRDVTATERATIRRLRTDDGWWNGDDDAIRVLRDFATVVLGEGCRQCDLVCERNRADDTSDPEPDYDGSKPITPMDNYQRNYRKNVP